MRITFLLFNYFTSCSSSSSNEWQQQNTTNISRLIELYNEFNKCHLTQRDQCLELKSFIIKSFWRKEIFKYMMKLSLLKLRPTRYEPHHWYSLVSFLLSCLRHVSNTYLTMSSVNIKLCRIKKTSMLSFVVDFIDCLHFILICTQFPICTMRNQLIGGMEYKCCR